MTATAVKPATAKTAPPAPTSRPIDFATDKLGARTMLVNAPTPEQLAVYQRTAARFDRDLTTMSEAEASKALDRSVRVVVSVLADQADVEWVEDQFLDGNLTLVEAAAILTLTIEAFSDSKANAPKTGPVKTARARRAR